MAQQQPVQLPELQQQQLQIQQLPVNQYQPVQTASVIPEIQQQLTVNQLLVMQHQSEVNQVVQQQQQPVNQGQIVQQHTEVSFVQQQVGQQLNIQSQQQYQGLQGQSSMDSSKVIQQQPLPVNPIPVAQQQQQFPPVAQPSVYQTPQLHSVEQVSQIPPQQQHQPASIKETQNPVTNEVDNVEEIEQNEDTNIIGTTADEQQQQLHAKHQVSPGSVALPGRSVVCCAGDLLHPNSSFRDFAVASKVGCAAARSSSHTSLDDRMSSLSLSTPSLATTTLAHSRSTPSMEQQQLQQQVMQQPHHVHHHHHHHNHSCHEDRHSHCELDLSSLATPTSHQHQLLSPPSGDTLWLRKASLPGSQGGTRGSCSGPSGGSDALLRRGSLPLTPASGAPLLLLHPSSGQHKCFYLPSSSDYFTSSSNHSVSSNCSNPSYLMRRSSSGSITLAPLREGSTDFANEDSMSQVEQIEFNEKRDFSLYLSLRLGGW